MGTEPFPRLLTIALLAPLGMFAAAYLFALMGASGANGPLAWGLLGVGTLVELIAIPAALFLVVRDWPRRLSVGNLALLLVSTIPTVLIVAIAVVLKFGHFHI